jgi:hypothetical protein
MQEFFSMHGLFRRYFETGSIFFKRGKLPDKQLSEYLCFSAANIFTLANTA